jgi:hypothetical protein
VSSRTSGQPDLKKPDQPDDSLQVLIGVSQGETERTDRDKRRQLMLDVIFIVATMLFFAAAILYVRGCERLR